MFGLGGGEMIVIGVVALIVVGPKDLPNLFRQVGEFTGKARGMAREFSRAMEAAADDSGVRDISKTIKAAANPQKFGLDKLRDATGMSAFKPGGATEALSKERADAKAKISDATAAAATARLKREAAAATAAEMAADADIEPATSKPAAKPRAKAAPKAVAKVQTKAAPEVAAKTTAKTQTKTAPKAVKPRAKAKPKAAK